MRSFFSEVYKHQNDGDKQERSILPKTRGVVNSSYNKMGFMYNTNPFFSHHFLPIFS